ncbi:DNA polymerase III subunit delta' [Aggregatilinea lenta]|uniref:DNA polymerase III subunit delta' n=1 Tax=Aggregatilinea lenta TaxID=913108 RepID=UPI000E5A6FF7|nr:DNA polymerase III subunit delta' [Aggregatilinea lenta]
MSNSTMASVTQYWPVIGHEWAIEHLDRALRHNRMRHAYLITGPGHIGKTTLARAFAAALVCTGEHAPCGECRACRLIAHSSHPDLTIIDSGEKGSVLKIEQVRDLQQVLSLRPYEARYRVAILRRFHEANPAAANALLKTLEEPTRDVVIILTAESTDALLPTIVSRCQPIQLRPLPLQTVRDALVERYDAPPEQAEMLARLSGGRIGWAIAALQAPEELELRQQAVVLLEQALQGKRRERFKLVEGMPGDKGALLPLLDVWQGYWRDALLLASGSQAPITNYDHAEQLSALAQAIGTAAAHHALDATCRTIVALGKNANARLALEVLMLDYPTP